MPKRRFTVIVPPAEAARLRAFDNATQETPWPLGPNRSFRRRGGSSRFVVKDYRSMGAGKAMVATIGMAELHDDDRVDVVVATRGSWVGWLLVAGGVLMLAVVPRDGLVAVAFAAVFFLAGWGLFLRRPDAEADVEAVEQVLRHHIHGEWRAASEVR